MHTAWMVIGALLLPGAPAGDVRAEEHFAPVGSPLPKAVTYDTGAAPLGSEIHLVEHVEGRHTRLTLRVEDLRPNHTFGAHVHVKPCGPRPEDAGPHYQNRVDPTQPSVDPAYANRRNEVWLDFTTDRDGDATALAHQRWRFRPGEARSVVIHAHATATDPGHAGTAGARLACVTVPLR